MLENKVSLKLNKYQTGYEYYSSDNYPIYVLGIYITIDFSECIDQWLKDATSDLMINGDMTDLEKIGNDIHMQLEFDRKLYQQDPEHWVLIISINQLIKVMQEWDQIVKNKPEYVIITEYNNKYTVIGSDKPHRPSQNPVDYANTLKIVMEYNKDTYSMVFNRDHKFVNLAQFLIRDVSKQSFFENWAKNSNEKMVSNNGTVLEKNGDYVLLYLQCDIYKYKVDPDQCFLSIEVGQFIYILEKWNRLLLKKPSFILIKEKSGRYGVIASKRNPTVPVDIEDLYDDDAEDD